MDRSAPAPAPSEGGASGFDFWLGEWDCSFTNGSAVNRITRILGDRVIQEDFRSAGLNGQSVSVFNEQRQLWMRMVWDEIAANAFSWDYQKESEDGSWSSQWKIAYSRSLNAPPPRRARSAC